MLCRPCLLSKWLELPPATLLPLGLKRGVGAADVCLLLAADPEEASSFCLATCLPCLGGTSAGMRHVSLPATDPRDMMYWKMIYCLSSASLAASKVDMRYLWGSVRASVANT